MGVPDSRSAVPTKDERRTDRLSMVNWLIKAPGNSASVAADAEPDTSSEKLQGGARLLPGPGIPIRHSFQKNQAPTRAPDIRSLVSSCEIHRTTILVVALPLALNYNLESTHDLGKGASARKVGKQGIGIEPAKYEVLLFGRA